jgi:hypothetical protein
MKSKLIPIAFLLVMVILPGCSLFKKKCDCPDHRRSKRIAVENSIEKDDRI